MDIRLYCMTLLAAGCAWSTVTVVPERLQIKVVRDCLHVLAMQNDGTYGYLYPTSVDVARALAAVHEAMGVLQVDPALSDDEVRYRHITLGYETTSFEPTPREKGEILMLVLVKSEGFPLEFYRLGSATTITWGGWDPDMINYSTSAWALWFQLYVNHNRARARPLLRAGMQQHRRGSKHGKQPGVLELPAGIDGRTMAAQSPAEAQAERSGHVGRHFRILDTEMAVAIAPMSRAVH